MKYTIEIFSRLPWWKMIITSTQCKVVILQQVWCISYLILFLFYCICLVVELVFTLISTVQLLRNRRCAYFQERNSTV